MDKRFESLLKTLKEVAETLSKSSDLKKWGFGSNNTAPNVPTTPQNGAPKADMSAWNKMAAPASTQNPNWQTPTTGPNAGKNPYERFTSQGAQKSEYQLAKEENKSNKELEDNTSSDGDFVLSDGTNDYSVKKELKDALVSRFPKTGSKKIKQTVYNITHLTTGKNFSKNHQSFLLWKKYKNLQHKNTPKVTPLESEKKNKDSK